MKHRMRTKEWLADTRRRARLTMEKLADLAGVHIMTLMYVETDQHNGLTETWHKIETALYGRVPAAFVNEKELIDSACAHKATASREGDLCRLCYVAGCEGIAFTGISPVHEQEPASSFVTLSWEDAIGLLEMQKEAFEVDLSE